MFNFLTPKQRRRVYTHLLGNLNEDAFSSSFFTVNEEYVRICFNVAYSDMRVVSLHSLPELCYFAPDWNKDHKVCRGEDWFKGVVEDPEDKYHIQHKKMIIELCLVMIDDVEREHKELIKEYKKQEKKLRKLRVSRLLGNYAPPKINIDVQK